MLSQAAALAALGEAAAPPPTGASGAPHSDPATVVVGLSVGLALAGALALALLVVFLVTRRRASE